MSRAAVTDVITVQPTNNVYTVLVVVCVVAELIAFIALFLKANDVFADTAKSLFG